MQIHRDEGIILLGFGVQPRALYHGQSSLPACQSGDTFAPQHVRHVGVGRPVAASPRPRVNLHRGRADCKKERQAEEEKREGGEIETIGEKRRREPDRDKPTCTQPRSSLLLSLPRRDK